MFMLLMILSCSTVPQQSNSNMLYFPHSPSSFTQKEERVLYSIVTIMTCALSIAECIHVIRFQMPIVEKTCFKLS